MIPPSSNPLDTSLSLSSWARDTGAYETNTGCTFNRDRIWTRSSENCNHVIPEHQIDPGDATKENLREMVFVADRMIACSVDANGTVRSQGEPLLTSVALLVNVLLCIF